ncbi:MAG: exonuclease domain-containing protein [Candidatus Omnitrophota bacterium]|nr:exonuclease domain-containing protein [Candidatus Omnitrophota bacterium]
MPKHIDEIEFTIFDIETTGLEPGAGDRVVEIAGLRFKGKERIAVFQALVNPGREVSPAAFAINRISPEMLRDTPGMEEIAPKFLDFILGSCLCSYNAGFDLGFLNNELKLIGRPELEGFVVVDVLRMSRRLLPNLERHALWFVARSLGIQSGQEHRASSDVELTLAVFNRLKEMLARKGITDFASISRLFAINPHLLEDTNAQQAARIQEAIDLGARLKIKYLSRSGVEVTEREVIPKEIKRENGRSYLVGFCCLRNDERTFSIDGILHLEII